jgi:glucose-1-phosphate thymidylyltransferase
MQVAKAVMVARDGGEDEQWPGFGFRARPLMPVANKPVLFHALEALRAGGIRIVGLVVGGATRKDIRTAVGDGRSLGVEVEYLDTPPDIGLVDVLRGAEGFLAGEPFVVQEGDALVHDGIGRLGARFAGENLDALVLRLPTASRRNGSHAHGHAASLAALGGCFLAPRALAAAAGPGLELPALLARVRELGGRVRIQRVDGGLPCREGREALLDANRRALEDLQKAPVHAEVEDSELQGTVVVHPSARLHSTLVRGPAIIGPRAYLDHAYVGPYTSLGADVVVEGSEVEHSIVLDGAQVRFLGARMEASIVGREARIGRDYGLPHAVRVVVADRAEVTLT